jgi:hypothetical protein
VNYLTLTWTMAGELTNAMVVVEATREFSPPQWRSAGAAMTMISAGDGTITLKATTPVGPEPKGFYHLKVTLP